MEVENHGVRYVSTFTFTAGWAERTEGVVTFDAQPRTKVARVLNMITSAVAARSVAKTLEANLEGLGTVAKKTELSCSRGEHQGYLPPVPG